jgi:hypothetical protein
VIETLTCSKSCVLKSINEAGLFSRLNDVESHRKNVHPRAESTASPDAQATSVLATILSRTRGRPRKTIRTCTQLLGAAERQNFIPILLGLRDASYARLLKFVFRATCTRGTISNVNNSENLKICSKSKQPDEEFRRIETHVPRGFLNGHHPSGHS